METEATDPLSLAAWAVEASVAVEAALAEAALEVVSAEAVVPVRDFS